MKRLLVIYILVATVAGLNAQVMWQVGKTGSQKWYLAQTDEFNDVKINPDMWKSISSPRPYNVNLDLYYKADNIKYNTGYLSLEVKEEKTLAKVELNNEESNYLKATGKVLNAKNEYEFNYSGTLLTSSALYNSGYFEMRFKSTDSKGVWPSLQLAGGKENEAIALFEGKGEVPEQLYVDVHCTNGCGTTAEMYSKKNAGGFTKLNEPLSKDWNIVSAEWGADYIKYFINGNPIAYYKGIVTSGKSLVLSNAVSKKGYGLKDGPAAGSQFPARFDVDYVRFWG